MPAITALIFSIWLAAARADDKKVVAYIPRARDFETYAKTIDYEKLTHINIAFENPTSDQGELSYQTNNDALITRAHAHNVQVLVSIGGGGVADNARMKARYFELISERKRAGFVARVAAYLVDHHLDGLDVDIEGPSINNDYGALIHDLSLALKPKKLLLTAALSEGYGGDRVPASTFAEFDFVNLMAYDATGPWNPREPGQHSSREFAEKTVAYWLKRGLPRSKMVLGVPFYGYGFGKAFNRGGYTYAEILAKYPGADRLDQVGDTIWYNGLPTIEAKTRFVIDQGLAGIMIWSLNQDAKGEQSLLGAIARTLKVQSPRPSTGSP
jgi:GH18 family chitinase